MKDAGLRNAQGRHSFSIEMASRNHVGRIEVSGGPRDQVCIEGELGGCVSVELIEGILLQISGENGVFRIDLEEGELGGALSREKAPGDGASELVGLP